MRWAMGEFAIDTDRKRLDLEVIHGFLVGAYWSRGVGRDVVARSIANSLCFGLYRGAAQIGFARVITDAATFGYLADVFVLPEHRGHGLGSWLVASVLSHPDLQGLRRLLLSTADAQPLYARHGFAPLARPEKLMEISRLDPYLHRDPAKPGAPA